MLHGLTPPYLQQLIPNTVGLTSRYNLRNSDNIQNIHSYSNAYYNSFLPSAIREWNQLSDDIKSANSLSAFKRLLDIDCCKVPLHFLHGNRNEQIIHARLRLNCSSLNHTLYMKNIIASP